MDDVTGHRDVPKEQKQKNWFSEMECVVPELRIAWSNEVIGLEVLSQPAPIAALETCGMILS